MPGFHRHGRGSSFMYTDTRGRRLRDAQALQRIRSLVIPPAWTHVWICPLENAHLQVTGRDARGRKQYRYHPRWRRVRDETKYESVVSFARALPIIRRRVASDLRLPGLPRAKVLAAVVRLLEFTLVRVGNEKYARDNGSFGLTTLRNRHVRVRGPHIRFHFRGKSGKEHHIELTDRRLARIVQRCRDLPGYQLFQYLDDDRAVRSVGSEDVNEYLSLITGRDFSAKDFRTWGGTVLAALALCESERIQSETHAKRTVVSVIKAVASELGNTPSICRKCYVHPTIIELYLQRQLQDVDYRAKHHARTRHGLHPIEETVVRLLEMGSAQNADAVARRQRSGLAAARRHRQRQTPPTASSYAAH